MSEAEAISLTKAGSPEAMEVLYSLHRQCVYRCCTSFMKNKEDAEDMTQEVFLHMFEKISKFKGNSEFRTWLLSLTRNKCLMVLRHRRTIEFTNEIPDTELPPPQYTHVALNEAFDALDKLPPADQKLLRQKIEGYLAREMDSDLQIPNIRSRIRLSQEKLREALV